MENSTLQQKHGSECDSLPLSAKQDIFYPRKTPNLAKESHWIQSMDFTKRLGKKIRHADYGFGHDPAMCSDKITSNPPTLISMDPTGTQLGRLVLCSLKYSLYPASLVQSKNY